jgi:hypothetical protein
MTSSFSGAESASPKRENFTNCGSDEKQKTTAIQEKKRKLKRVPFTVSRLMEFCTTRELVNQTGHDTSEWPLVVLKELIDNALDASEEAGIAPVISVTVEPGSIVIEDNGPGIPAKTIEGILDYSIRVSSREAYVSPTRGAQGNALKTVLAMAYALDEKRGEDASGTTTIEAHGVAHQIEFSVDHIKQEPKITHTVEPSPVVAGTKITIRMAKQIWTPGAGFDGDIVGMCKTRFLRLAGEYAWINPHLSLKVTWEGEVKIDFQASNPAWKKWLPSWPTSPHWYDKARFRRYMAAHIANRERITVREFISEFDGMSGTAKQKAVLAETGTSHVSLHDFFGRSKANSANIEKLLAALKAHTAPVKTASLGVIGKDHFFRMMEAAGGDTKTFNYQLRLFEADGVPHVVEFAFGVLSAGLTAGAPRGPTRITVTGVNCSPGIRNPFQQIGRNGAGLDTLLAELNASSTEPVIAALHLICPRVSYTDRGKSAIVIDGESKGIYHDDEE